MASLAEVGALLQALALAAVSGGVAAAIGYWKHTPKESFDLKKGLRTVLIAVFLPFAASLLGISVVAPETAEAAGATVFGYALTVYAAEAVAVLVWRRALVPAAAKLGYTLPG